MNLNLQNNTILRTICFAVLIASTTAITTLFLTNYCDSFSALGLMAKKRLIESPILMFVSTPLFFWISAVLCRKFSPHSAGHSMRYISLAMKDVQNKPVDHDKVLTALNPRIIFIKTISSLICSFGGGALGREGPSVHISTSFFSIIGDKFKHLAPKISLETWIFAGSAAGIAIAFHSPISGFAYILEKLIVLKSSKFKNIIAWIQEKIIKLKATNFLSSIIWSLVVLLVYAKIYNFSPMLSTSRFHFEISVLLYLVAIMTAILCGLFAQIFKTTGDYLFVKFSSIKSNLWHLIPITGGLMVAVISSYSGIYSFSGGIFTANEVLSSSEVLLSYSEVVGRAANTMLSFISGCAGGLISPAIAIGAGIGSIISNITPNIDTNVFVLIGMTAFLSPILGSPIAAAIMILEITGQPIDVLPVLLCTSLISYYSFKGMNKVIEITNKKILSYKVS